MDGHKVKPGRREYYSNIFKYSLKIISRLVCHND